ncbi:hypothetical protein ACQR1Y_18855 [Bradyrhizobium sp. HKCCYLRH3099]|uniref:hypothetical protein n=1 Tax=unclassified Bradyrhizobium TaxID=2631580 RepID=UPI003EBAFED5
MSKPAASDLTGLFIVDLQNLRLSQEALVKIDTAIQKAVKRSLAGIDDAEGFSGGPLGGGIAGFRAL